MLTILFYNSIVYISTFLVWISGKLSGKFLGKYFFVTAFLLFFFPSALRYGIGTDFFSYIHIYENIYSYGSLEIGYKYLNLFLKYFNLHPQWVIVVTSFIFSLVSFMALQKEYRWLAFLVLMLSLWFFSFNGIRQAISIVFSIFAFKLLCNGKFLFSIFFILLGSTIHQSLIILIPLIIISFILYKRFLANNFVIIVMYFFIIFSLFMPFFLFDLLREVLVIFRVDNYSHYLEDSKHFAQTEGTNLVVFSKILFVIYAIKIFSEKSYENVAYGYMVLLLFLYGVSLGVAAHVVLFSRMSMIFSSCLVCAIPLLMKNSKGRLFLRLPIICFLIVLMAAFLKESVGSVSSYGDPMLNPYKVFL